MRNLAYVAAAFAGALVMTSADAEACGGCFVGDQESTLVTGHRMAMAISTTQTTLWDQIEYAGNPEEFSWVLPVKPGARVEVANDAWFEVLDATTATTVSAPFVDCWGGGDFGEGDGSFGCGTMSDASPMAANDDGGSEPPAVQVVHQGTVGPYETVTLSADEPAALNDWLDTHGYEVPDDVQPIINDYVSEGFDFIALKLIPGTGVSQMRPVRVISPGASFALPLRMVAAGTGASTALKLFVLGEGRYEAAGFSNTTVDPAKVLWSFGTTSSNYSELRAQALAADGGHTWLTTYALTDTVFKPAYDDRSMSQVLYQAGDTTASTIAAAYVQQGIGNGEGSDTSCLTTFQNLGAVGKKVVDNCDENGECSDLASDQIGKDELACGELDDLALAMVGMQTRDVRITRLEAELPRSALTADLVLAAATDQTPIGNRITGIADGDPCAAAVAPLTTPTRRGPIVPAQWVVAVTMGALGMFWFFRRRRSVYAS